MNLFYLFALQWNRLTNNHTIHGLWPQYSEHRWPEYCTLDRFNSTKIENLIPTLNAIWPSINTREEEQEEEYVCDLLTDECECNVYSNVDFWKHEWARHGTCNYNHFDEYHYFYQIIDLYNQYGNNYKCHPHLPCMVKFDTHFNLID